MSSFLHFSINKFSYVYKGKQIKKKVRKNNS